VFPQSGTQKLKSNNVNNKKPKNVTRLSKEEKHLFTCINKTFGLEYEGIKQLKVLNKKERASKPCT
jgi:hypothetical protein